MKGWDPEVRLKAVAVSEALGIREASEATGVPSGTIKRWRFEDREARKDTAEAPETERKSNVVSLANRTGKRTKKGQRPVSEPGRTGKKDKAAPATRPRVLDEPEIRQALSEAGAEIKARTVEFADQLFGLAAKAVREVDVAISTEQERPKGREGVSRDRDGAAWVRSLVGVMAQAVEKAQLLSGKATGRVELAEVLRKIGSDAETSRAAHDILKRVGYGQEGAG
jgi:hypothetical protein